MKLQSVYRHYWPDTAPYASILRAILEERARLGDDVCVLTGQPSYNDNRLPARPRQEVVGGVRVRRFRLPPERKRALGARAGSLLWFLARAGVAVAAHESPDLILVNGHPPVGMGFFARAMRRWHGVPYVYHCQDIHPEALLVGGHVRPGRMFRLLRSLDTQTCMGAAAVVVLSDDMRKTMLGRGIPDEKLVVINNFDPAEKKRNQVLNDLLKNEFKGLSMADPLCHYIDPDDVSIRFSKQLLYWGYETVIEDAEPQLSFRAFGGRSLPRSDFLALAEYLQNHSDLDKIKKALAKTPVKK